jgi:hypothetical protein
MTRAKDISKIITDANFIGDITASSFNGGQIGGRRNIVINGAMQVFQRGTSFTSVSSTAYHADRFELYMQNTASVYTVTQDSDTPNGFGNSLKLDVTTADTSTASNEEVKLYTKLEGQDLQQFKKGTSDAEQMTLSFYVKTNKTGTYVVELFDRDNTREVSASYTVSDTNWNRYTLTFPADTTGAFDDDNASSLEISFWLIAGSAVQGGTLNTTWRSASDPSSATGQVNFADSTDNNWAITGVQLEIGSQATPFEHRSFGEERQLCYRYYYQMKAATSFMKIGHGRAYDTTNTTATYPVPVPMRANPTGSVSAASDVGTAGLSAGGTTSTNPAAETMDDYSRFAINVTRSGGGYSAGTIYQIESDNNTNMTIKLDAEL